FPSARRQCSSQASACSPGAPSLGSPGGGAEREPAERSGGAAWGGGSSRGPAEEEEEEEGCMRLDFNRRSLMVPKDGCPALPQASRGGAYTHRSDAVGRHINTYVQRPMCIRRRTHRLLATAGAQAASAAHGTEHAEGDRARARSYVRAIRPLPFRFCLRPSALRGLRPTHPFWGSIVGSPWQSPWHLAPLAAA
ncbi:unnamed protein product, partial [Prorocentrum cordatum]